MPIYRDLNVQIRDDDDCYFHETEMTVNDSTRTMSCYIQSEEGVRFTIFIKVVKEDAFAQLSAPTAAPNSEESTMDFDQRPIALMATLHVDGREQAEKETYIYLSDDRLDDQDYRMPTRMNGRAVRARDGSLQRCIWSSKAAGIETIFERMDLRDAVENGIEEVSKDLSDLTARFAEADETKAGQIKVTIQRIRLAGVEDYDEGGSELPSLEAQTASKAGASNSMDLDHTVETSTVPVTRVRGLARTWNPIVPAEDPYATFIFYYRSKDALAKRKLNMSNARAAFVRERAAAFSRPAPLRSTDAQDSAASGSIAAPGGTIASSDAAISSGPTSVPRLEMLTLAYRPKRRAEQQANVEAKKSKGDEDDEIL